MRKPINQMARVLSCFVPALLLLTAISPTARALINQHYTPVDLVNQSEVILKVQVGPLDEKGPLAVKLVKVLSGKAPEKLTLEADTVDDAMMDDLEAALGDGKQVAGLLFVGDFSAAADDPVLDGDGPVGMLHIGTTWFALSKTPDKKLRVGADPLDLMTVWAGSNAMLERLVQYVLVDYAADVPIKAGVAWGGNLKLADVAGPVGGCAAIDLFGDGKPCLLILADGGDRLFRPGVVGKSGEKGKYVDAGGTLGLDTRSKHAAWGDFNGDGRLDLASWDGQKLSLRMTGQDGKLQAAAVGVTMSGGCLGLSAFDLTGGQIVADRAGLLVTARDGPAVVILDAEGKATATPLRRPVRKAKAEGPSGPCVVADFDGDGTADLLQPCAEGLLFFKGQSAGKFAAPTSAGDVGCGEGLAAAFSGDYDADGRLDLVAAGKEGCFVFRNLGGGRFREVLEETGEVAYISKPNAVGAAPCDINNDGRQEFVLLYPNMGTQFYFNRGFCCFGYAVELELSQSDLTAAQIAVEGQQAAAVADFNADGAQDLAVVTANGQVWLLLRDVTRGPKLGVTVTLRPHRSGPVSVIGYDGKRCLGAQAVTSGSPGFFGKRTPASMDTGPITLRWQVAGNTQTATVNVTGPTRFRLPKPKPRATQ